MRLIWLKLHELEEGSNYKDESIQLNSDKDRREENNQDRQSRVFNDNVHENYKHHSFDFNDHTTRRVKVKLFFKVKVNLKLLLSR